MRKLRVNEIFGPTFQGEGPHAGQSAVFLRTSGCNLNCSWCDTPYTWDWERYDREAETHPMAPNEVDRASLAGASFAAKRMPSIR